jgi:hypothetical protein
VSARSIEHRLAAGRLRRLYSGAHAVYAVGHEFLTLTARATAAALATGPASAASHWTTLSLHGLIERPRPLIHVIHPLRRRPVRGLFIHRAVLPPDEVEIVDGVSATTRTCLDLSGACEERTLRTLIKAAEFKQLLTDQDIADVLDRYPRRRGRRTLARIAAAYALTAGSTLSPIEDDFAEFCGQRGLPMGAANAPIVAGNRTRIVDRLYGQARLAVEFDGRDAHTRELVFEDDRERDRALTAAGWRPIRITRAQLRGTPDALEADLPDVLHWTPIGRLLGTMRSNARHARHPARARGSGRGTVRRPGRARRQR